MGVAVTTHLEPEAAEEMHRLAVFLRFLTMATRETLGTTLAELARRHSTQRSNLSVFIRSGGTVRNVSRQRAVRVLWDLGCHESGELASHQAHRWCVDDAGQAADLAMLLDANRVVRMAWCSYLDGVARTTRRQGFLATEMASGAVALVKVAPAAVRSIDAMVRRRAQQRLVAGLNGVDSLELDPQIAIRAQDAWMASDSAVQRGNVAEATAASIELVDLLKTAVATCKECVDSPL